MNNKTADLEFLVKWVSGWVQKMHRDIPDEERGKIADDMCCDWTNSGIGASYKDTLDDISARAALGGEPQ